MRRPQLGSTLIAVLLIIAILLVAGVGLLARKSLQYDRVDQERAATQALALAQSGLEDALVKYGNDIGFPPQAATNQPSLSYTEEVYRTDGTTLVGRYIVTIDTSLARPDSYVALIRVTASTGPVDEPQASHSLAAELDLRSGAFVLTDFQDLGGF